MHYIVGTSFRVNPNPKNVLKDRRFTPGEIYTLIHIVKKEDKVTYTFKSSSGKIQLDFKNCREGDNFISKFRNENVPDYEKLLTPVVDNVAD